MLARLHTLYARLVYRLDTFLRVRTNVFEYADEPQVIFRIGIEPMPRAVLLSDGTRIEAGERVVQIHLRSDHIPLVAEAGSPLVWGRRMNKCLDISLDRLAHFLQSRPDLADIRAIRTDMTFGTEEQSTQLLRICGRYQFESVPAEPLTGLGSRLHRLGENILILMLILARNPATARPSVLLRTRTPAMISRARLEARYLGKPAAEARAPH